MVAEPEGEVQQPDTDAKAAMLEFSFSSIHWD
jgi:hypothetical protein